MKLNTKFMGKGILQGDTVVWIIHRIPCNFFKLASTLLLVISIIMLISVFFMGKINGAHRWLRLMGYTIQPSELAKISLIGYAAFIMATVRNKEGITSMGMKLACIPIGIVLLLIAPENWSTAGIIGVVMLGMLYYARAPKKFLYWTFGAIVCGAIIGGTLIFSLNEQQLDKMRDNKILHRVPMVIMRIKGQELPADPTEYEITDKNLQVTHAKIAVASCNIIGKGPGSSTQRDYLPLAFSDFIYSIIIEEGGFASGAFVMFLYLLLMWRAMKIAGKCKYDFPSYLVLGLAMMIVTQAMVNMAVAVGAAPVTGQTLPLVSKGGTSTFVCCAYIGMILSVSRTAKKKDGLTS